jgi:hypothetical protein
VGTNVFLASEQHDCAFLVGAETIDYSRLAGTKCTYNNFLER